MLKVVYQKQPVKFITDIRRSNWKIGERIKNAIENLQEDPTPNGTKKLTGFHDYYRIRVGKYRIVYKFDPNTLTILIIEALAK